MRVGDLVINVHTEEIGIITEVDNYEYVVVDNRWLIPKEHLEVLSG